MASLKLAVLLCLAGLLGAPLPVPAADAPAADGAPAKKARKARAGKSAKFIAPEGTGETAAARATRLKRECKGRPNAGACTGHTD